MKSLILGMAIAAAAFPALAQTNVSVSVGQPGFYGQINIGDFGPPPVVYTQPVIVQQPRVVYEAAPVYLRVPEGHRKHWSKWCGRYNACGQRVLFVRDEWYTNTYVPRYREQHYRVVERRDHFDRRPDHHEYREYREEHHDRGGDHGRGHDEGRGHGEGHGNGHGNGHGRGHGHD
jgi:hypothetical protein